MVFQGAQVSSSVLSRGGVGSGRGEMVEERRERGRGRGNGGMEE